MGKIYTRCIYVRTKEAFNRKMSLITSKLKIELKKNFVGFHIWNIELYGPEIYTLRKLKWKYLETFQI